MLTCRELTALVTDYLEGHLSLYDRVRFELHIGLCHHCRTYLRQMKATVNAIGRVDADAAPPAMSPELLERFRAWKS